jgi:hypothetical protein
MMPCQAKSLGLPSVAWPRRSLICNARMTGQCVVQRQSCCQKTGKSAVIVKSWWKPSGCPVWHAECERSRIAMWESITRPPKVHQSCVPPVCEKPTNGNND